MRKLTALGLSLLLCTGAFAQYNPTVKAVKGQKSAETTSYEMPDLAPSMRVKGQPVNNKLVDLDAQKIAKLPGASKKLKVAPAGAVTTENIYGDVIYPSPVGTAKVSLDGNYDIIVPGTANRYHTAMGVKDGKLFGFIWTRTSSGITTAEYEVVDLESGLVEKAVDMAANFADQFLQCGTYVSDEDAFYGYSYNGWVKYDCATGTFTTPIPRTDSSLYRMTYNLKTGKIVGVNLSDGVFKEFDKSNGAQTIVTTIPDLICPYIVGLGYDYSSDNYIYNVNTADESTLVAINPSSYAVTKICDVANMAEIGYIYIDETVPADPLAPKAATFVSSNFVDNSLKGTVVFKMPTELNDSASTAITGNVDYIFSINGTETKKGSAAAGSEVTFNVEANTVNGMNDFALVCAIGEHSSKAVSETIYLGNDVPSAPTGVKLTAATVTWNPVTTSVHNGYMDLSKLTYTVAVNGNVIARNVTTTSCPSYLPANVELTEYVATVYAECNGMTSVGGNSAGLMFGTAFNEPVVLAPTESEASLFNVVDNNKDNKTWAWAAANNAFKYTYSASNAADDYLFLPPVQINDMDVLHEFAFTAWAQSASFPEYLEVYIGTSPTVAAMTQQILPKTLINGLSASPQTVSTYFSVPKAGSYYIGIKAVSDKNMYNIFVNNFSVDKSDVQKNGPAAVVNATATPGAEGALNATVSFTMPSTNNLNDALDGNVTVVVTSLIDQKTVTGAPGAEMSVELNAIQGDNEFEIVPSTDGNEGLPVTITAWCGMDIPVGVDNLTNVMDETNFSGTLKWEAPTEGVHNGYLPTSGFTYSLYQYVVYGEIFGIPLGGWEKAGEIGTDVFEYTVSFDNSAPTPLQTVQLAVGSADEAGEGTTISVTNLLVGDPYEIPAYETYVAANQFNYSPVNYSSDPDGDGTTASLTIAKPTGAYASGDDFALKMTASAETYGIINLPKFSTKGMNKVAFIPTVYNGSCDNVIYEVVSSDGEQQVLSLSSLVGLGTNQYVEPVIELPAKFQDKGWIQIRVYVYFTPQKDQFYMTHYALKNMVPEDLKLTVGGADKAFVGEAAKFTAEAKSIGTGNATLEGVKFTAKNEAGDVLFENTVAADTIVVSGESVTVECEFTPTFDNIGSYTLTAELTAGDDVMLNNTASKTFTVAQGSALLVDDLTAKYTDDNETSISLAWTAPSLDNFESFEDMTPFEVDPDLGDFTQHTDGKEAYTWQTTPEILNDIKGKPGFHIMNGDVLNAAFGGDTFSAPDGQQFAMIFCPGDQSAADSWLVSPTVAGGSNVSFYGKAITEQYGKEVIELCYSTVDNDSVDNFVVLNNYEIGETWEEITATLPADAKRFAIHYISQDIFGLMIDAIKYTKSNSNVTIIGYDVYRATGDTEAACTNFEKIGTAAATNYVDATADVHKYNMYYVIPKLSDGTTGIQGKKALVDPSTVGVDNIYSAQAVKAGKGYVAVIGYEGENVVVAAADGKVYYNAVAADDVKVNVPAGVYVVTAGKTVAKVVVK